MDNSTDIHDYQQEAEEAEALSLCDFPITTTDQTGCDDDDRLSNSNSKYQDRRSSSEPTDFFEFFNHLTSEMSPAEDIIFCGKLIPFKQQQQQQSLSNNQIHRNTDEDHRHELKNRFHRRRSESLSELNSSQSNKSAANTPSHIRNSRSLDYRKLHRTFSTNSEIRRNSSLSSSARSDNSGQKVPKPRWYLLMFGLAKFPPEMELKDMKNRQVRRTPSTMFPTIDGEKKFPANRSHRKSSWGLLRILSCKGHASVAVTASFGCMP